MNHISKHQIVKLFRKWVKHSYYNLAILDILNELEISGMRLNVDFVQAIIDNDLEVAEQILITKGIEK